MPGVPEPGSDRAGTLTRVAKAPEPTPCFILEWPTGPVAGLQRDLKNLAMAHIGRERSTGAVAGSLVSHVFRKMRFP